MRDEIFQKCWHPVEYTTASPIVVNRLSLLAESWVELLLLRCFGEPLSAQEVMLLNHALKDFGRLAVDSRGSLVETRNNGAVPWKSDPEVQKLVAEIEEARKLTSENADLRSQLAAKKESKPEMKP